MMTREEQELLRRQLDLSEALHHKIMAKMGDERFDLLDTWESKERIDLEIGRLIRRSMNK
jgi:hypothetical protein